MSAGDAQTWITAELDRIWLLAERRLREFQRAGLRAAAGQAALADAEAIFAARHRERGGVEPALALANVERRLPALRSASAFGRVVARLGLSALELETLLLALAPHVDPPLADVFAALRGTAERRGVDLALVAQLHRLKRAERVALLAVLDPERPMLAWELVRVVAADAPEGFRSAAHRSIQPTAELVSLLCGGHVSLSAGTELRTAPATLDELELDPPLRERVAAMGAMRAADPAGVSPWIVLWGPRGAGKRTLAARLAAHARRPLLSFDPRGLDGRALDEALRRAQRTALVEDAVLFIGPLAGKLLDDAGRALEERLRAYPGLVALGVESLAPPRLRLSRPLEEVELTLPSEPVRVALWRRALAGAELAADADVATLARGFHLTPGEILDAAHEARAIAAVARREVAHADLRRSVERRMRNELGQLARRIHVSASWDDLVLPDEDGERVLEFVTRARLGHRVYTEWGLGARIGYGRGLIALLSGPPGTGKTMLAGLIARELDLDLYQVDLSQVISKWVGETEKHLAQVFDQAQRAHAVLLFDEADSLFAKRTDVESSNDRYANLAVNYLLQRLEQYSGVAVLTTNKESVLDDALARRLTLHLRLEVPEVNEREALWRSLLPKRGRCAPIDVERLAVDFELTGGTIRNIVLRAAFLAARDDRMLDEALVRRAAVLELEDLGRVVMRDPPAVEPRSELANG